MQILWSIIGLVASIYAPVVSYVSRPAIPKAVNAVSSQIAGVASVSYSDSQVTDGEYEGVEEYMPNEDDDYVAQPVKHTDESNSDNGDMGQTIEVSPKQQLYKVINVVDGDTLDVSIGGKIERLRLIGINTPETVDPRRPVQCFGIEASNRAKELLSGKSIILESDLTQGERDKYGRLLRYVRLSDGRNFNEIMISDGYAYEYTYDLPYKYQQEFKQAEVKVKGAKRGLWADNACGGDLSSVVADDDNSACTIKGNISAGGEKIYHMIGCAYYSKTNINESEGEKWFCSEDEAEALGWRKAKNC